MGLGYAPEGWRSLASVFPDYNDTLLTEMPGHQSMPKTAQCLAKTTSKSHTEDPSAKKSATTALATRPRDVPHPQRQGRMHWLWRAGAGRRKTQIPQLTRNPGVSAKGRELYGLYEARFALREAGYVLVTEGYMDVVALAQAGLPNAVATLGTACTPTMCKSCFALPTAWSSALTAMPLAGALRARRLDGALPYATDVRSVKFLFLPPEHDPDSFIRANGQEAFAQCVKDAMPLSRFLLEASREDCDMASAEGRCPYGQQCQTGFGALAARWRAQTPVARRNCRPGAAGQPRTDRPVGPEIAIPSARSKQTQHLSAGMGSYENT